MSTHSARRPFRPSLPLLALLAAAVPAAAQRTAPQPVPPRTVGPQDAIDPNAGNPVASALHAFGVSTDPTPRMDEMEQELGENYSPLGGAMVLNRTDELVLVGLDLQGDDFQRSFFLYQDGVAGTTSGAYDPEILADMGPNEMEDVRPATTAGGAPQSYRAVDSADLDGDGREEVLVLFVQGNELRLRVIQDESGGFATSEQVLAVESSIDDVAVTAADADGDGKAEVLTARAVDGLGVTLSLWKAIGGAWVLLGERQIAPAIGASAFSLVLEHGNVDNDLYTEWVLVVDENADPDGLCRWFLYDDLLAGGGLVAGGPLFSTDAGVPRVAVVGDVALGDIDGDQRDEIVLAGLTRFGHGCEQPDYLVLALDDAEHGLAELGTSHFHHDYYTGSCTTPKLVRWAHVNTADLDGDGRDEIQVNQWIYDDWVEGGDWTAAWTLPDSVVLSGTTWQYFDRSTSAFTMGDYDGDGHADVLTVRAGIHNVQVYGFQLPSPNPMIVNKGYVCAESYSVNAGFHNPLLVMVNVDADSPVLSYSGGQHEYVFTEPIVIAALAAPPYQAGIAQNYGACSTTFGNTTSTGSESERTLSFSASASVGVNLDGGALTQSEFELEESLSVVASQVSSQAYQLDRTILFQSGWDEDLVVFTTIPTDVYTYTVVTHPDPSLVGSQVVLRLPRDPITLQADRVYYNEHIPADGMRVDQRVFTHVLGDVSSYPTRSQKNALLNLHGGLQHGPVSVGQGSGSTQVAIQVSNSVSNGGSLEIGYELAVKATAGGAMAGFTVGASASDSLTITSGTQTTYTGTVGAIGAADFAANQYQFGLFTYVLPEPNRGYEFEVLNYWVE